MQVRNVPGESSADELKEVIEACGINVKSIVFEPEKKDGKQLAIVRFHPLPLPWTLSEEDLAVPVLGSPAEEDEPAEANEEVMSAAEEVKAAEAHVEEGDKELNAEGGEEVKHAVEETPVAQDDTKPQASTQIQQKKKLGSDILKRPLPEDGRRDGDASKMARFLSHKLVEHRLQMGGQALQIDAPSLSVTLFLGNVLTEDDDQLRAEMEQYGPVDRCFVMRNPEGLSKGYGFVEYCLPAAAHKAREVLDEIFRKEQSDHNALRNSVVQMRSNETLSKQEAGGEVQVSSQPKEEEGEEACKEKGDGAGEDLKQEGCDESKGEEEEAKQEDQGAQGEGKEAVGGEQTGRSAEAEGDEPVKETGKECERENTPAGAAAAAAAGASSVGRLAGALVAKGQDQDYTSKVMRAELTPLRTVYSLFAKSIYMSNLPQVSVCLSVCLCTTVCICACVW
jgi:hypothetical protein